MDMMKMVRPLLADAINAQALLLLLLGLMLTSCHTETETRLHASATRDVCSELQKTFDKDFPRAEGIHYKVKYCSVKRNWACLYVQPYVNGAIEAEPRWALFTKDQVAWRRIDWSQGISFESDFERIDLPERNSRIAQLIVAKHPDCPMAIFPKSEGSSVSY